MSRKIPTNPDDEAALSADIVALAIQYGRYGYRRITAMLRSAGSDLASIRTRAVREDGGWRVNGTKLWTTNPHLCHYMILSAARARSIRTGGTPARASSSSISACPASRSGLSETSRASITSTMWSSRTRSCREDAILGQEGDGWAQVTGELAWERRPERFLPSFTLLVELMWILSASPPNECAEIAIGRLGALLATLRRSASIRSTVMVGLGRCRVRGRDERS